MSWSREQVLVLIEEYQKWPNLYQVNSPQYKNRNLRRVALEDILNHVKMVKPGIQEIQAKFQALKQNAAKEHKKYLDSLRSGAGLRDVIEPSLWYYQVIRFAFDQGEQRVAIDSLDEDEETLRTVIKEDDGEGTAQEVFTAVVSLTGELEEAEVSRVAQTPHKKRLLSKTSSSSGASQPGPSRIKEKKI